jgi:hypothetical protein
VLILQLKKEYYKQILKNSDDGTWVYWVFELCPLSGILKNTKEHNVSETGPVPSSGEGVGDICSVGSIRKRYPQSLDVVFFNVL